MRIDSIPIWALFVGTIIIVMLAIEAGYRLGRVAHRRSEDEKESPVSAIAGTILGLAAFMLAFTFGIVSERHDAKKGLVRDDAISIRTAWQRSDFLPETDRAEAKDLLRQYVDLRVTFAQVRSIDPDRVKSLLSETQRIQDRLWNMAVANARKDMNSDVAALYIESLNEVSAIHARRVAVGIQGACPSKSGSSSTSLRFSACSASAIRRESQDPNAPWCSRSWPCRSPWCSRLSRRSIGLTAA